MSPYHRNMNKNALKYEQPTVVDHGSLAELTAALDVGGPTDAYLGTPPGHSCPPSGAGSKGCK
jgi:hypothetical protein